MHTRTRVAHTDPWGHVLTYKGSVSICCEPLVHTSVCPWSCVLGGAGFSPSGAIIVVMNGLQLFGPFCLCTYGLAGAVPREGVWLGSKPKRTALPVQVSDRCRVTSLTAVEGGPGVCGSREVAWIPLNGLRGGVFVTDRIWDQLGWFGGDVGENRSTEGLSSLFLSSPRVLDTEKLCTPWSLEIWSSWSDNQHFARGSQGTRVSG